MSFQSCKFYRSNNCTIQSLYQPERCLALKQSATSVSSTAPHQVSTFAEKIFKLENPINHKVSADPVNRCRSIFFVLVEVFWQKKKNPTIDYLLLKNKRKSDDTKMAARKRTDERQKDFVNNGKWVMELGIRLMKWKWMLFSSSLVYDSLAFPSPYTVRVKSEERQWRSKPKWNSFNRFTL